VVLGYNPALAFLFSDPLIDRENQLYFSASLSYSQIRNRSKAAAALAGDFDEKHYDIGATLGKRFTLFENAGIAVGYQIVQVGQYQPGVTASTSGRDAFIYATVNYVSDTRDLREYPSHGQFLSLYTTKVGFGESGVDFMRFGADVRRYIDMPWDVTLASRAFAAVVAGGGMIPTHSRVYFGYGERIRGHFYTVFEGENLAGLSLELRYPILTPRILHFTAVPLPEEFSVWRFGISAAIFGDTGLTWFRGDRIRFGSFASGYGAGLHFLLPYSFVVRTLFAYNEYREGQLILDVRNTF
jgi:outer membrane protein assembly factor BamA